MFKCAICGLTFNDDLISHCTKCGGTIIKKAELKGLDREDLIFMINGILECLETTSTHNKEGSALCFFYSCLLLKFNDDLQIYELLKKLREVL